jgi:hypothetical protein
MILRQLTGTRPTDAVLLEETSHGIAAISLANKTFGTGQPLLSGIEEAASFYQSPERNNMYKVFIDLRDYAFDDMLRGPSDDDIYHAFAFVFAASPVTEFFNATPPLACEFLLNAAHARDKLHEFIGDREPVISSPGRVIDYDQSILPSGLAVGLTIYELALLAQMKEQSVRNALQRDPSVPRELGSDSGQIEVPLGPAFEWLKTREGFKWYRPISSPDEISVPVARDGSFFSTKCKQGKGYAVGKKGEEQYYETLSAALAALKAMDEPYWRRPSPTSGVPGIVKGVGWVGKTLKDLGQD